jgi:hypothetical protein
MAPAIGSRSREPKRRTQSQRFRAKSGRTVIPTESQRCPSKTFNSKNQKWNDISESIWSGHEGAFPTPPYRRTLGKPLMQPEHQKLESQRKSQSIRKNGLQGCVHIRHIQSRVTGSRVGFNPPAIDGLQELNRNLHVPQMSCQTPPDSP